MSGECFFSLPSQMKLDRQVYGSFLLTVRTNADNWTNIKCMKHPQHIKTKKNKINKMVFFLYKNNKKKKYKDHWADDTCRVLKNKPVPSIHSPPIYIFSDKMGENKK